MEATEPLKGGLSIPGIPSIPGVTSTTPAEPSGQSVLKGALASGFTLPLWSHLFFTGMLPGGPLIPYAGPFFFSFIHTFGVNGINLLVSNSMSWAAGKALLNLILSQIGGFIAIVYSGNWWAPYLKNFLLYGNPWFVFDIVQVLGAVAGYNAPFTVRGYKIPFANSQTDSALVPGSTISKNNKSIGFKATVTDSDGNKTKAAATFGLMTAIPIAAILVLFMPALTLMSDNLPPQIKSAIDPVINNVFWVVGIISSLVGGTVGIGSVATMLPTILSYMKPAAPAVQTGGGNNMPTVEEIVGKLVQDGGAKPESSAFMGILAFTVVAGISLAAIRGKQILPTK